MSLEEIWNKMNDYMRMNQLDRFANADRNFHMKMAHLIPNPLFALLLETIYQSDLDTFGLTKAVHTAMKHAQDEHAMILAGLKNRNAAQTKYAIVTQIENTRRDFRRMSMESEVVNTKN